MNTCCLVKLHNLFNKRFQIKLVIVRGTDLGIETEIIDHLLHGRNLIDVFVARSRISLSRPSSLAPIFISTRSAAN